MTLDLNNELPPSHCCYKHLGDSPRMRMICCPTCGHKRCPKASDCSLDCTNSNEAGQPGSCYTKVFLEEQEEKNHQDCMNDAFGPHDQG